MQVEAFDAGAAVVFLDQLIGLEDIVGETFLVKLRALLAQSQKAECFHNVRRGGHNTVCLLGQ